MFRIAGNASTRPQYNTNDHQTGAHHECGVDCVRVGQLLFVSSHSLVFRGVFHGGFAKVITRKPSRDLKFREPQCHTSICGICVTMLNVNTRDYQSHTRLMLGYAPTKSLPLFLRAALSG
jgi:hypothetical protein